MPDEFPRDATGDHLERRRDAVKQALSSLEPMHALFFKVCLDYLSLVEILEAGLNATDADRTKCHGYVEEMGQNLHDMLLLEARLRVVGAEGAMSLMQRYRSQATAVKHMLRLELPVIPRAEVNAVANELFRRKRRLDDELAKELKEDEEVSAQPLALSERNASLICKAWDSLRGLLQEHSTEIIHDILGKAGLPMTRVVQRDTDKSPLLDEAGELVRSMTDGERYRFIVGCLQEVFALELEKGENRISRAKSDASVRQNIWRILTRLSSGNWSSNNQKARG